MKHRSIPGSAQVATVKHDCKMDDGPRRHVVTGTRRRVRTVSPRVVRLTIFAGYKKACDKTPFRGVSLGDASLTGHTATTARGGARTRTTELAGGAAGVVQVHLTVTVTAGAQSRTLLAVELRSTRRPRATVVGRRAGRRRRPGRDGGGAAGQPGRAVAPETRTVPPPEERVALSGVHRFPRTAAATRRGDRTPGGRRWAARGRPSAARGGAAAWPTVPVHPAVGRPTPARRTALVSVQTASNVDVLTGRRQVFGSENK